MMINVDVIDLKTNTVIRNHKVCWVDKAAVAWLFKLETWAFHNGHGVQKRNIRDKEPSYEPQPRLVHQPEPS